MSSAEVVISQVPIETRRFTWKIANFAKIRHSKEALLSQYFHFEMGAKVGLPTEWKCFFSRHQKEEKPWLGVYIMVEKSSVGNASALPVSFKVKIPEENFFNGRCDTIVDLLKVEDHGYGGVVPCGISTDPVLVPLDSNGNLCLELEINLFNWEQMPAPYLCKSLHSLEKEFGVQFLRKFHDDMINMFENPEPNSKVPMMVKLVSSDGKKFSVNRGILAARSPVFLSMFKTPMLEVRKGIVKIKDVSGLGLEALLVYIHTGLLPDDWKDEEVLGDFCYAAQKYLFLELVEFMNQALVSMVTQENGKALLELATKLGFEEAEKGLRKWCLDYVRQANWEEVCQFVAGEDTNTKGGQSK